MSNEYQFRPLGKTCAGTGRALSPGERCVSALVEKNGEVQRLDYSHEAWNGPPEGTIGVWKCQVPPAASITASRVDPERLLQFFEQLLEMGNPAHDRLIYVVALYLLQRRRLRLEGAMFDDDGVSRLNLIGSRGEGPYHIRDQQLPEAELQALHAELNRQLSEEFAAAEIAA
jgi:hypothetical protein